MCLNPRYIIHPTLKRIHCASAFDMVHLDGVDVPFTSYAPYVKYFDTHTVYNERKTTDYVKKHYYVYNSTTGETHPLFFGCPCDSCVDCLGSKYSELSARLQFEALSYPDECRVIFFTLTYSDAHLPFRGVSREDITDFRNLLHIYARRYGLPTGFREFIVSEYGTDPRYTHRPHYHGLIFGLDLQSVYGRIKLFTKAILKAWKGRGRLEWEFARSNHGVSKYCTKYVIKGLNNDFVPKGKNPNFISYPIKSGGLGVNALKNPVILDKILNSTDGSITVNTLEYGEAGACQGLSRIRIPRFIIDKLFPPFSRFITSNIKRCLRWASYLWNALVKRGIECRGRLPDTFEKKFGLLRTFIGNDCPHLHRMAYGYERPTEYNISLSPYSHCLGSDGAKRARKSYLNFINKKDFPNEKLLSLYNVIVDYLDSWKYSCAFAIERVKARAHYLGRFSEDYCYKNPVDSFAYKNNFVSSCYRDSALDAYLRQ